MSGVTMPSGSTFATLLSIPVALTCYLVTWEPLTPFEYTTLY